ncbi:hypothetical protein [Streptomyces halstedii]|uniref:Uncharacterized protein n=1 Tax=Streptomyces halstedii TaxID=1944 RepID=A0A6N9UC18_STRHA|nr:hypothetical protein [Streptomyces halstedii]NEA19616.1 hypothetical protein [Streptomyces halstedii]
MFELNRRTAPSPELVEQSFVQDIETFVAGTVAPSSAADTPASLLEAAFALTAGRTDWLRWGLSGMPMTGEQIAAHAEAAITVLRTAGWNPSSLANRGIGAALRHAETADTTQRFSSDTNMALDDIFALLIRALTGAPFASCRIWDGHPARRVEEVFGLLAAAAAFARTYGDPAPAA